MAETLGQAVLALSTDSGEYKTGMVDAKERARDLDKQFDDTGEESKSLGRKLSDLGDRAGRVAQKFQGLGRGIQRVGEVMLATAVGALKLGADFDAELAKIQGLVGVTADELAELREGVLALGPATGKGPQELAEGLFFVTSAGFEGAEALDVLEAAAQASAAGLGETATVADAVTSALNAYADAGLTAGDATGILVATVREGKAEADSIAGALGAVLPIASELGVEFDEVGASIAAMTRLGLNANEASTALRGVLKALLDPASQSRDALAEFGLSAEGLKRQLREEGLLSVLDTLKTTFGDNQEAMAAVFPDIEGLTGVLNLVGANAEETREIFASLANATEDDLAAAFAVAHDTTQNKFDRSLASLSASLIKVSDALLPIVIPALDFLAEQLARLPTIIEQLTFLIENFSTTLSVLGDMILGNLSAMVENAVALVTDMVDRIWAELVGRLQSIATSVGETVDEVTGFFEDMWTEVVGQSFVPDMIDAIAAHFARLPDVMVRPAEEATSDVKQEFESVQSAVSDGLGNMIDDLGQGELSWRSFGATVIDVLRQILEAKIAAAAQDSGGGGGFDFADILSFAGTIFASGATGGGGGGRALGGGVNAFETVLVGERGPELFRPNMSGTVIPNHALSDMGGGLSLNFDIDATGAERGVEARIRQAVDEAVHKTLAVIESSSGRGGRFARLSRV